MNKRMMSGQKSILSVILSLLYLFVAPVMQVLPVYAAEPAVAHTVWDFMITQLVGANCIITDSAVLNAYGSALGGLNAATATAAEIDTAIATAAVNCGVDLAPVFSNTVASAASVGIEAGAATAGENLAATCASFFTAGEGSAVIPALGQAALDAAGATAIVAGIAYIGKMVAETMGDVIKYGQKIDFLDELVNMPTAPPTGYASGTTMAIATEISDGKINRIILGSPAAFLIETNGAIKFYILNTTGSTLQGQVCWPSGTWANYANTLAPYTYDWGGKYGGSLNLSGMIFHSTREISAYVNKFKTGEYQPVFPSTPSIASSSGYQKYNPDFTPDNTETQTNGFPDIQPLPDYANGYGLSPIDPASYQALVDAILEVPGNPSYREEQLSNDSSIAEIVQPSISPFLVPLPEPGTNPNPQPTGTPDPQPTGTPDPQPTGTPDPQPTGTPDPGPNPTGTPDPGPNPTGTPDPGPNPTGTPDPGPNPTGTPDPGPNPNPKPDTQPFPDPDTVPQPTPVVNPTPDSDVVPGPVPYPDPETPTEQDKTDTDTKITPIDLRDKFPFCIPFDIVKIMKLFQGGREAPCFTWEIPFGQAGSGSVTVDLSAWDDAASLLRTLELILFIMLLAVGTRNLIGGSS